jgi:hypothetical protein
MLKALYEVRLVKTKPDKAYFKSIFFPSMPARNFIKRATNGTMFQHMKIETSALKLGQWYRSGAYSFVVVKHEHCMFSPRGEELSYSKLESRKPILKKRRFR